nr:hypothetical protein BCU10_18150 [Vibrio splendidus]
MDKATGARPRATDTKIGGPQWLRKAISAKVESKATYLETGVWFGRTPHENADKTDHLKGYFLRLESTF